MSQFYSAIKIYHNPDFLNYRGDHDQIIPPIHPVATVHTDKSLSADELLSLGYSETQHVETCWYNNTSVMPHLRSTSVGDLIALEDGSLFVVESMGFSPYKPDKPKPAVKVAEACRALQAAVDENDTRFMVTTIRQAIAAMEYMLVANDAPVQELPKTWDEAKAGDLIGNPSTGQFRVIARKLPQKWRAEKLLVAIPDAQIWLDTPRAWAVLVPEGNRHV